MKAKILIAFVMFMTIFSSCSCEASFTTANFSDLAMAKMVDEEIIYTDTFEVNTDSIYLVGEVKNNPGEVEIKGEWYYLEGEEFFIDSAKMTVNESTKVFNFSLSKPDAGWPTGKYEVRTYINDKLQETISFKVE